jgi:hypothetical protein
MANSPYDPPNAQLGGAPQKHWLTANPAQPFMDRLDYGAMYGVVFASPNWFLNILLGSVCFFLIPIVGPIVMLGYRYEALEQVLRDPNRRVPDFDFGRFGEYLSRGIWPFLVGLVAGLLWVPVIVVMYLAFLAGLAFAVGLMEDNAPLLLIPMVFAFYAGLMLAIVFMAIALVPLTLRAGLTRDFGRAFDLAFAIRFLKLTLWESVLGFLYLYITGIFITMFGLLLLCIGVYPAGLVMFLAQGHLELQLYQIFLSRGGDPIPMPTSPSAAEPSRPSGW